MFDREVDVNKHDQNECEMALCRVQYALFLFLFLPFDVVSFCLLLQSISL